MKFPSSPPIHLIWRPEKTLRRHRRGNSLTHTTVFWNKTFDESFTLMCFTFQTKWQRKTVITKYNFSINNALITASLHLLSSASPSLPFLLPSLVISSCSRPWTWALVYLRLIMRQISLSVPSGRISVTFYVYVSRSFMMSSSLTTIISPLFSVRMGTMPWTVSMSFIKITILQCTIAWNMKN